MNVKTSVFAISVETRIHLLLYNLHTWFVHTWFHRELVIFDLVRQKNGLLL